MRAWEVIRAIAPEMAWLAAMTVIAFALAIGVKLVFGP
jgi:hypothetical protein